LSISIKPLKATDHLEFGTESSPIVIGENKTAGKPVY